MVLDTLVSRNDIFKKDAFACKINACRSIHILKAYAVSSHTDNTPRELLAYLTIFQKCQTAEFYVGESDSRGAQVSLETFSEFKDAMHSFNKTIHDMNKEHTVVFDDLDDLLKI